MLIGLRTNQQQPFRMSRLQRFRMKYCQTIEVLEKARYSLAGDAVLIAPVSTAIPCKQGTLQGILPFSAFSSLLSARNAAVAATFGAIP
jgi:hypothetical protein